MGRQKTYQLLNLRTYHIKYRGTLIALLAHLFLTHDFPPTSTVVSFDMTSIDPREYANMTTQAIDAPPSLPVPNQQVHAPGVYLLKPLSRLGSGPGMIILTSGRDLGGARLDDGVPSPFLKWAEEGYAVVAVCLGALEGGQDGISSALEALSGCNMCQPKGKVGLIG